MHGPGPTANPFQSGREPLETDSFEFQEAGAFQEEFEPESPFDETEEMELAADLLEVASDAELDQFLGRLFRRIGGGLREVVTGPLGGILKGIAKKALPVLGSAAGTVFGGTAGGVLGSRLASGAGKLFGLELEGLSPEDQEFEVARRFVRLAGAATRKAARTSRAIPPLKAARRAIGAAARRHAPGLLGALPSPARPPAAPCSCDRQPVHRCSCGRLIRHGRKVVVINF
jgi:hypothetical protein